MELDKAQDVLWNLGREYGFRYDVPIELEDYFAKLVKTYDGSADKLGAWLREKISADFLTMEEAPRWKQDPQWPVLKGKPMIFVGQLDRKVETMDVSFYVFKDHSTGVTKVVTQVIGRIP